MARRISTATIGADRWEQHREEGRDGDDSPGWWTDHLEELDRLYAEEVRQAAERERNKLAIIAENLASVTDWEKFRRSINPEAYDES